MAPSIVEEINTLETYKERNDIYKYIYSSIVKYCVNAIKNGEYDKAYLRYKAAVLTLEEQFLSFNKDYVNKKFYLKKMYKISKLERKSVYFVHFFI